MKHLFISHMAVSDAYGKATAEERKKFFALMKESAKEYGINLLFWGTPWGVIESLTVVYESDKSLDNYAAWRGAWGRKLASERLQPYGVASNTVTVTAME